MAENSKIKSNHCLIKRNCKGVAHIICNLKTGQTFFKYLPSAFESLSIYAAH